MFGIVERTPRGALSWGMAFGGPSSVGEPWGCMFFRSDTLGLKLSEVGCSCIGVCPCAWRPAFEDQAFEKGIWWMPWHAQAMKDVALCDKPRGDESDL